MKIKHLAMAVAFAIGASQYAYAETSSAVRGNVQNKQGEVVAQAQIEIVHLPSGTRSVAYSNSSGQFVASGLRVGGPYRITVSSGNLTEVYDDIFLNLGDAYRLNALLASATPTVTSDVERITITGSMMAMDNTRTGPGSTFSATDIEKMPLFDRDIKDVIRQNPLVVIGTDDSTAMSIGGSNPRFNSLVVDGMRQDDDFGLNRNGYPTRRSPIPIEAISQVSVSSAPYQAKTGGFTGGGVSAVTKSGTNEFTGSVFLDYASDSMAGKAGRPGAEKKSPDEYTETVWGVTFGGPLIKDKLFFFGAYERWDSDYISLGFGPKDAPGVANPTTVSQSELDLVTQIARDVHGVDVGQWDKFPDEYDKKLLLKLDWNINNEHRFALTYQDTDVDNIVNNRSANNRLALSSNYYTTRDQLETITGSLYSNWTSNFTTDIKVGTKKVTKRHENLAGISYGQVSVATESGTIQFGEEIFRHANVLDNDLFQFRVNAEYLVGDHTIEFGWDHEKLDVFNLFVRLSKGDFYFDSIEDFRLGNASSIVYENAIGNDPNNGAANFSYSTNSFYLQDRWEVNYDLTLDFGLRYERISQSDKPSLNQNFANRYGFDNTANFDGMSLFMPRFGFNYALTDDMNLRGGFGRFGGGRPNVWISNSYSNDGISTAASSLSGSAFENVRVTQIPQELQDTLMLGDGRVDAIDPDLKMPSEWKYSIGLDYIADLGMLGSDWFITADYIYTDKERDVFYKELSRELMETTTAPDGRVIYKPGTERRRNDIVLTNVNSGRSNVFALGASKNWDNLSLSMGYSFQDITDISGGTSSQSTSSYDRYATFNRNEPFIGRSDYQTRHRFNFTLSYANEFFSGYESRFTLYGERRSGENFSYTMHNITGRFGDSGNDGRRGYLFYVPTGENDPNVRFEGWSYEDFAKLMSENGLNKYAGSVAPRNIGSTRYINVLDFKFEQEIPGFMNNHKGSFFVEVKNLLNLIDSSQGRIYGAGFPNHYNLGRVDYDLDANQYVYSPNVPRDRASFYPLSYRELNSTWRAKVGVRYRF